MKLSNQQVTKIKTIWDEYVSANKMVLDTKGNPLKTLTLTRKDTMQLKKSKKSCRRFIPARLILPHSKHNLTDTTNETTCGVFRQQKVRCFSTS